MLFSRPIRMLTLLAIITLVISACAAPNAVTSTPTGLVADAGLTAAPAATAPAGAATGSPTTAPTELPTSTSVPTDAPTPTEAPSPTRAPTASPTIAATPTLARPEDVLEAKWFVDSDGNVVPDFLEMELGADPKTDECAPKQCGTAGEGLDLLTRERNTLLVLDASGSMAAAAGGGESKMQAAKGALLRFVNVAANVYNLGFLVYGHKGNNTEAGKAESCAGIELLAPLGQLQRETFSTVLDQFQPTGWTPIAAALTEAGKAFQGKEGGRNRIVLVSDGIETCGGDPVAVAQQLYEQGLAVQIDVLGFDIAEGSADAAQLRRIAEVTRGSYYDAKTAADLDNYFRQQSVAVGETYDAMICEVSNFAHMNICDTSLINKVQARFRELAAETPAGSAEAQAYAELAERINTAYDERQQQRRETQARFEQLQDQYFDLREQIQKALQETYVGR